MSGPYVRVGKRLLDVTVALAGLVAAGPVMLIVSIAILIALGAPVLFRQMRPGYRGRSFALLKFRTMGNQTDAAGDLLPDRSRLGSFGALLRSTSLDELPTLWNVLVGDMSIVGPRPLLQEYLPLYSERQKGRHDVRPGITGWAQVHGRNALSWEERFDLDLWYVENLSLVVDARIVLRTIAVVLSRRGVSAEGEVTMPRFTGTKESA